MTLSTKTPKNKKTVKPEATSVAWRHQKVPLNQGLKDDVPAMVTKGSSCSRQAAGMARAKAQSQVRLGDWKGSAGRWSSWWC